MNKAKDIIIKSFLTVCGTGYLPVSGTFGSAVAVGLYLILPPAYVYAAFVIITVLAFPACKNAERLFGKKDPSQIVIDEVIGQWLPLLILHPEKPAMIWLTFILFRIFDALKVPPVDWAEKQGGSGGILWDDILAGLYTLACMTLIQHVMPS
jgi:phosphatidylglycerophosphatase A